MRSLIINCWLLDLETLKFKSYLCHIKSIIQQKCYQHLRIADRNHTLIVKGRKVEMQLQTSLPVWSSINLQILYECTYNCLSIFHM